MTKKGVVNHPFNKEGYFIMRFNVHAGHNPDGKIACGAVGIIKESTENRKVVNELIKILKEEGHTVYDCTVNNGTSASDVINKIVTKCNAHTVDYDISIHFNCGVGDIKGNGNTTGVEVLVYNNEIKEVTDRICNKISKLGYRNRGTKVRTDLGFLRKTKAKALLVECCFVDDKDDIDIYSAKNLAKAIAEGLLNKTIKTPNQPVKPTTGEIWYRAVCGSFNNKDYALKRKLEIEKKGFDGVFLDAFIKDEKTWFRVISGSFKTKSLAEQRIQELTKKGFDGCFLTAFKK